ncbi:MAG: hypothetical protein ACOC2L_02165 [Candidatus Sumerlaeota bacterium]
MQILKRLRFFTILTMLAYMTSMVLSAACAQAADESDRTKEGTDADTKKDEEEKKWYLAYNLWYEKPTNFFCINYKTGTIIPAGTEVKDIHIISDSEDTVTKRPEIVFTTVEEGRRFSIGFEAKYHPGKTIEDYKEMMFTNKDFEELTDDFSEEAVKAIKDGVLVTGMTREEVICSYGPPPEHETPMRTNRVWKYWMNRWKTKEVHFNKEGKTIRPQSQKLPDQI